MKDKKPYERIRFTNGVRLILVPLKGVDSVATAVMVGVGSRYETPQTNGISHFLEHMVFKGTKKYPTTDDVNIIEKVGGLQNAYTDIDITNYHNKALASDWLLALDINKELAIKPLLEEKHVDKERDVILEEMKRYEDEPEAKVAETFHTMLYRGTTLGMRIIGEEQSLRSVASKELRGYHDRQYSPERMVVVVAGELRTQNLMTKKVEEWFGRLTGGSAGEAERVVEHQKKPQLRIVTKPDVQQAHMTLGFRTFSRDSEDRFAWSVFNLIMGVSFTSRLFKEIREGRGLCYHIRSTSDSWKDVGNWNIYAGVATEKVEEALKAILAELAKARDKGITKEELTIAKKRLKTFLAFRSEDPEFFTEWYGRQEVYGQEILTVDDYVKRIDKITKEDINRLIHKYFRTETLNMALVWNRDKDDTLERLLKL